MGLKQKNKKDFSFKMKDSRDHGENIVFIKGGSILIGDLWVVFKDIRIDVQGIVERHVKDTSIRLFNERFGILYILITIDKTGKIEVVPSLSYNKKSFGDIKVFPNIPEKFPLVLVRLQQDGSSDLRSFVPIKKNSIEVHRGYGNFTLYGHQGVTGIKGVTGAYGATGFNGDMGDQGQTGHQGYTGLNGHSIMGITGLDGPVGETLSTFILDRS